MSLSQHLWVSLERLFRCDSKSVKKKLLQCLQPENYAKNYLEITNKLYWPLLGSFLHISWAADIVVNFFLQIWNRIETPVLNIPPRYWLVDISFFTLTRWGVDFYPPGTFDCLYKKIFFSHKSSTITPLQRIEGYPK